MLAVTYMNMSMTKKSRMEELKAKLAKSSAALSGKLPPVQGETLLFLYWSLNFLLIVVEQ